MLRNGHASACEKYIIEGLKKRRQYLIDHDDDSQAIRTELKEIDRQLEENQWSVFMNQETKTPITKDVEMQERQKKMKRKKMRATKGHDIRSILLQQPSTQIPEQKQKEEETKKHQEHIKGIRCEHCDALNCFEEDPKTNDVICVQCGSISKYVKPEISYENAMFHLYETTAAERVNTETYDPLNNWYDHLNRVQGRENTIIPMEIIDELGAHFESREPNFDNITVLQVVLVLRGLKKRQYYAHAMKIYCMLTNKPSPVQFTKEQENVMTQLFVSYVKVWPKVRVKFKRKSLLFFPYVILKLSEMLNFGNYIDYVRLLTKARLEMTDKMWAEVCKELGWPFHKTSTVLSHTGTRWYKKKK
jgi:hypothetical protein